MNQVNEVSIDQLKASLSRSSSTDDFSKELKLQPSKIAASATGIPTVDELFSTINLGHYETEELAAKIYNAAAWILFGASAHYNFPIGTPSSEHRQSAKNYIERHLNKLERRSLWKMKKKPQVLIYSTVGSSRIMISHDLPKNNAVWK